MSLGGDLAEQLVPEPGKGYFQVLHDPLGIQVLIHDKKYETPNRGFAHWTIYAYFMHVPLVLQKFTGPVNSIYLSSAIAKTLI